MYDVLLLIKMNSKHYDVILIVVNFRLLVFGQYVVFCLKKSSYILVCSEFRMSLVMQQ